MTACTTADKANAHALGFDAPARFMAARVNHGGFAKVLEMKGLDPTQEARGANGEMLRNDVVLTKPF